VFASRLNIMVAALSSHIAILTAGVDVSANIEVI
jgi:hypothetical protein